MKRKNFLIRLLIGFAALIVASQFQDCTKNDQLAAVDFTIDLTQPQYGQLGTIGGYVVINNVIIAKDQANLYIACSALCTYDGSTLTFNGSYNQFVCPSDYSKFDINGNVVTGPATTALVKYNTEQIGTSLRVYST